MSTTKLRHIAIAVTDMEKAAAFYENAFGLERVKRTKRRIYLSDGVMNLTLLPSDDRVGDPREGFTGLHHIGMVVDDLDRTGALIKDNGGSKVDTPESYSGENADRKYWDPNGIMVDISRNYWVGSK
jgi:methylmalonyl-CoA/ethylmalonyl-CoA epimerase